MSNLGYARVSTTDQNPDLQIDALTAVGCEKIWTDTASGATADRPQLRALLDYARPGDTITIWSIDRLGRSLIDLVGLVNSFEEQGINFRSLTNGFDTTTSGGRLVFEIFAALAEYERNLIRERTRAGLDAAKARGRIGGRRSSLNDDQVAAVRKMHTQGDSIAVIARAVGTSRPTVYRVLHTK